MILPVLDRDGDDRAVYLQARYLHPPGGRKYDNPTAALAGPSPRLADVRLGRPPVDVAAVLVCEGLPDGLIAAQAGHRASALLGAGLPDDRVAGLLMQRFATERLVIALDADDRGRAGAARLAELLGLAGRAGHRWRCWRYPLPGGTSTAGSWRREHPSRPSLLPPSSTLVRPPSWRRVIRLPLASPRNWLIHYRHVLVDDPVLAARNVARLRRVVAEWERSGSAASSDAPVPNPPLSKTSRPWRIGT